MQDPTGQTFVNFRKIRAALSLVSPQGPTDLAKNSGVSRDAINKLIKRYEHFWHQTVNGYRLTQYADEYLSNADPDSLELIGRPVDEIVTAVSEEMRTTETMRALAMGGAVETHTSPIMSQEEIIEAEVQKRVAALIVPNKRKKAESTGILAQMGAARQGREMRVKAVDEEFNLDAGKRNLNPFQGRDSNGWWKYNWVGAITDEQVMWFDSRAVPNLPNMGDAYDPSLPGLILIDDYRALPKQINQPPGDVVYSADPKWREIHQKETLAYLERVAEHE